MIAKAKPCFTTLLKRYHRLPEDEQLILQVLSVIYEPINQTTLQAVLRELEWTSRKGAPLASLMIKPLREKLIRQGLILLDKKNALRCHPEIVESLIRKAVSQEIFSDIDDAKDIAVPLGINQFDHYGIPDESRELRQIRSALYRGKTQEVLNLLLICNTCAPGDDYYLPDPLYKICTHPLDLEWIRNLPDEINPPLLSGVLMAIKSAYPVR